MGYDQYCVFILSFQMLYRYSYFIIESPIEEIWSKTINFWNFLKGEMVTTYISDNLLRRKMVYKHDSTGQFINKQFVLSLGELYSIEFGYNRDENCTYVTLEVSFHWFGRDNVWRVPQDFVNKWLDHLGFEFVHLQHGKTIDFLRITEKFEEIEKRKKYNDFCLICGAKLGAGSICSDCGYSPFDLALTH